MKANLSYRISGFQEFKVYSLAFRLDTLRVSVVDHIDGWHQNYGGTPESIQHLPMSMLMQ